MLWCVAGIHRMVVAATVDDLKCISPNGKLRRDSSLQMVILKWFGMEECHFDFLLCSNSHCIIVAVRRFVLRGILKLPAGLEKGVS